MAETLVSKSDRFEAFACTSKKSAPSKKKNPRDEGGAKGCGGNGAWGREGVRVAQKRLIVGGGGKIIPSITIITTTLFPCISWWDFRTESFQFQTECENAVILACLDDFA